MTTSSSQSLSPTSTSTSSKHPSASSSTTDLKIRPATFQDYEAVVELSKDMYDGIYDYMKTMFFQFLHSKDHHVYVMEHNQQLVGLAMPKTNPEKELLTSMSSRVRPSFAGHGVFKDGGPLPTFVRDHHPSVQHRINCSIWRSGLIYDLNPSTKIFYNWSFYRLKSISLDHLRNRLKLTPASSPATVKELSYSESVDMLQKDGGLEIQSILRRYASEFVPAGLNWLPVGINKEGLKHIFSTSTVAATFEAVGPVHTEAIQSSPTNSPLIRPPKHLGKLTSISYSNSIPGNGNLIASTLFFFGDDVTDLLGHFRFHIRHLANICKDDRVAIALNFPMTIPKDHVIRLIEEFLDDNKGIYTPALCYRSKL